MAFVEACFVQITQLLSSLDEGSKSARQSRSAYSDGEC